MKKVIPILLLLLVAGTGLWFWWQQNLPQQDENRLSLYGNVDIRELQLAFNASEHIDKMPVEEGDFVKKGQLVATLHTELLNSQLQQTQAQVKVQQQVIAKLKAGSRPEEIQRAYAQLKAAKSKARAAQDTYKRREKLLRQKLIAPEEAENARSLAEMAHDEVEASEEALKLLQKGTRIEDIAAAEAQLQALQAGLSLARQRLENASLHAPESGIIRNRISQPGEMVFPQTPVLTLALTNPVWVRAYLPEPELGKVPLGAKAEIYTDSFPDKVYQGWVGYISPTAEFTPKNVQTPELRTRLVYSMRVFACNPDNELRLGMPATVTIELGQQGLARQGSNGKRCE